MRKICQVWPEEIEHGQVFFHGYGWGTFERVRSRVGNDKVIHYRSREGSHKIRSTRWYNHHKVWVFAGQ